MEADREYPWRRAEHNKLLGRLDRPPLSRLLLEKYVHDIHLLCVMFTREPSLNYSRVAVTSLPAPAPFPTVDLMYCCYQASAILFTHIFVYSGIGCAGYASKMTD